MGITQYLVGGIFVLVIPALLIYSVVRLFWVREERDAARRWVRKLETELSERPNPLPDGTFKFEWQRDNLPDAFFMEVVQWIVSRDQAIVLWQARTVEWRTTDRINHIKFYTEDKQEAMLFKLTFGGAL